VYVSATKIYSTKTRRLKALITSGRFQKSNTEKYTLVLSTWTVHKKS